MGTVSTNPIITGIGTSSSGTPATTIQLLGAGGSTSTGSAMSWPGGAGTFGATCAGWNGANLSLQFQPPGGDGTTWVAVGVDTSISANGGGNFNLPPCQIRAAISGAVPSSNVFASAAKGAG